MCKNRRIHKLSLQFSCRCILVFIALITPLVAWSQQYPENYFGSPLTIPLSVAGNYGELRLNHFHYGLDFRTNNREGLPVVASADGFVSRVKISGYGYGKVIYIDHPNGFTSVYGHLSELKGELASHVRKSQYASQKFEFEYYPKPGEFPVKKGDIIALSGNSGSSQGPHLHFEIRHTKSEEPINPLLFSFPVPDSYPPALESVSVYSFGTVPGSFRRKEFAVKNRLITDTLIINGKGGIGYSAFDKENEKGSRNGVYETILIIETDTIYHSKFDRFSFEEARYVNCHLEYSLKKKGKNIEKTFLAPNNKAPIYLKTKDRGVIDLNDTAVHMAKLILRDQSNNNSQYTFRIRKSNCNVPKSSSLKGELFKFDKTNIYKKDGLHITIPAFALYDDLDFSVKKNPAFKGAYSPVYSISSDDVPLQSAYIITITPSEVQPSLKDKLVIISLDDKGRMKSAGGEWVKDALMTDTKTFGNYAVYLDTIAPFVRHIGFKRGGKLPDPSTIRVRAYDNLGDVKSYRGTIDGEWKLFEFDAKSDQFTYTFDEKPDGKKHTLGFECIDDRGNKSVIFVPFIR